MTVKEYLGQAYLLDKRIKSDSMELDELRLMAETISSPGFEEHYNASKNTDAPYIKTLERIFDMESKIMDEMNILVALKNQIRDVISQVEKPEIRCIWVFNTSRKSNHLSFLNKACYIVFLPHTHFPHICFLPQENAPSPETHLQGHKSGS